MKQYDLNYSDQGHGKPIVLLHGMLGSLRYWQPVVDELRSTNRVISLDLLGFGDSPKPKSASYSVEEHIGSIKQTLETAGIDESYTLAGHSMGSLLALRMAADSTGQIDRLALIGMPVYKNAEEARKRIVESGMVSRFMVHGPVARATCALMCTFRPVAAQLAPIHRKELPKEVAQDSVKHTWQSYSRSLVNIIENQNVEESIRRLRIPTVALYGDADELTENSNIYALEEMNPNVTVVIGRGTHHLPLDNPDLVIDYLRRPVVS